MKKLVSLFVVAILCFSSLSASLAFLKKANAEGMPVLLGFKPNDTVMDPSRPVIYMTKIGSKTLYAVNYETGAITTLTLPYPSERLDMFNGKLYVTQHKMSHDRYNFGPYSGAIAEVDAGTFTLSNLIDVEIDPYDVVIDKQGYMFIAPGSGQRENMKVYSIFDHTEKVTSNTRVSSESYLYYNEEMSKVYSISSKVSPRDVTAHEVRDGVVISQYDSPYHGAYDLEPFAKIAPDGENMYNNSGVVFGLSQISSGDMLYNFELGQEYNDFAFSIVDDLAFGANVHGGIDVYRYNSDEYLYSIKTDKAIENLHYHNGGLVSVFNESGKYYLEYISDFSPEPFSLIDGANTYLGEYGDYEWEDFYDGATNIHTGGEFSLLFNHPVEIADKKKISIVGPEGQVPIIINAYDNELTIFPDKLKENTSYTLKIEQGAITGYFGVQLSQEILINFKTFVPPVDSVTVDVDTSLAPDKYILNASAKDGFNAQYKFLINENGTWKVLQDYSLNYSFAWRPTSPGGYAFKVMARSEGRTNSFDVEKEFFQQVIDNKAPVVTLLKQNTTAITRNNVILQIESEDNFGVKRVKLPNGEYFNDSKALYEVTENGSYVFVVEDTTGNTKAASILVNNIDKIAPVVTLLPSTTAPTRNSVYITVNSSDNTKVKRIKLPNGTFIEGATAKFPVSSNGTFTFTVEDIAGNITVKSIKIANIDKVPPPMPTANAIYDSHTWVRGKTIPNVTVYVKAGSRVVGKVRTGPTGIYTIKMAKQAAGTKMSIYSKDAAGNQSKVLYKTVLDKTPPKQPVVNKITYRSTLVTGLTEKYSTVFVYNGKSYVGKAVADYRGYLKVKIKPQRRGATLTVYAVDKANNKSKPTYVKVY